MLSRYRFISVYIPGTIGIGRYCQFRLLWVVMMTGRPRRMAMALLVVGYDKGYEERDIIERAAMVE